MMYICPDFGEVSNRKVMHDRFFAASFTFYFISQDRLKKYASADQ